MVSAERHADPVELRGLRRSAGHPAGGALFRCPTDGLPRRLIQEVVGGLGELDLAPVAEVLVAQADDPPDRQVTRQGRLVSYLAGAALGDRQAVGPAQGNNE